MSDSFLDLPVQGFSDQYTDTTITGQKALRIKGEINVVTVPDNTIVIVNTYNDISALVASALASVTTYTAPIGKSSFLQRISAGGSNVATYEVQLNGIVIDKRRTYFGSPLTTDFTFGGFSESGLTLAQGDVVRVLVIHERPFVGDFESRIQVLEIG